MHDKKNRCFHTTDKTTINLVELSKIVVGGMDGIIQNDINKECIVKLFLHDDREQQSHNELKKMKQISCEEGRKIIDSWTT